MYCRIHQPVPSRERNLTHFDWFVTVGEKESPVKLIYYNILPKQYVFPSQKIMVTALNGCSLDLPNQFKRHTFLWEILGGGYGECFSFCQPLLRPYQCDAWLAPDLSKPFTIIHHFFKLSITTHYLTPKFHQDHVLVGCGISDDLDTFNKFPETKLVCVIDRSGKWVLVALQEI